MSDGLTGVSTTLLMALAGVGAALLPILGEHDGTQATTIVFALLGLVPWALVAGGVRLSSWLFCVLALVPGVLILVLGDNSGGMFPLMLALVYLVWSSPSLLPAVVIVVVGLAALVELTIDKGSADDSGIIYFAGGLGISWMSGALLRRQEALTARGAGDARRRGRAAGRHRAGPPRPRGPRRRRPLADRRDAQPDRRSPRPVQPTRPGPTPRWRAPRSSDATASTRSAR